MTAREAFGGRRAVAPLQTTIKIRHVRWLIVKLDGRVWRYFPSLVFGPVVTNEHGALGGDRFVVNALPPGLRVGDGGLEPFHDFAAHLAAMVVSR